MSRLVSFVSDRFGWPQYLKPFMKKPLPEGLNWTITLGSVSALLFVIQAVTGMFLAMYYTPSPDHAYQAIGYIMTHVSMGRILRGIHHWGASAMVIIVFVHMVTNFFYGAFKAPRELTWIIGLCLFLLTLGFGFTGYLLPWDQKAFWATVVSSAIPKDIPVIGKLVTRLLLGGERVSGLTLTRFYAIHTLMLPALTAICIVLHIYLVRVHDICGHGALPPANTQKAYRFFPEHLAKSSIVFGSIFTMILLLAVFAEVPLEEVAGTIDPAYLPRPEWYYMWLFQLLTFFPGKTEVIGSLVIPLGGILLLFGLPFLSKNELRKAADRPLATAAGITCLAGIVYLTIMGFAGARPYGEIVVIPDRELTASEKKGLVIFVDRECAYCHNIMGRGGRLQGPDLSNVVAKGRTKDWLIQLIKDPQTISRWSIMPKYDLSQPELDDLADFILTLDFDRYDWKALSREEALGGRQK